MKASVLVTFRGIRQSRVLKRTVEGRCAKLMRLVGRPIKCDVVLESPHASGNKHRRHRVRLIVTGLGKPLVAAVEEASPLRSLVGRAFLVAERLLRSRPARRFPTHATLQPAAI